MSAEKERLVVKDMYTEITHAYPMSGRKSSLVLESIKFFTGRRRIQLAYSDNAPEFINAMRTLSILHDTATPGVPKTNSIAERTNQLIIGGTVTSLIAAGLPPCYWSYAAPYWCINYNTERINGESNWDRLWKEPFHGTRFPFGCKVIFKPSDTRKLGEGVKHEKWDPKGKIGIFAGYKLRSGY